MKAAICTLLAVFSTAALAQPRDEIDSEPKVVQLTETTYRVGPIELDTLTQTLRVPGRVLRREPPLEYFAVTLGGAKGYESLLELDVNAFEFNLACILVGLDTAHSELPRYQFDTEPAVGQQVRIEVAWQVDGKTVTVPAGQMLKAGDAPIKSDVWAYTGSYLQPDGRFFAQISGTLIGFVHDPASVIEHVEGLGIGGYGTIGADTSLVPAEGTSLTVSIAVVDKGTPISR